MLQRVRAVIRVLLRVLGAGILHRGLSSTTDSSVLQKLTPNPHFLLSFA